LMLGVAGFTGRGWATVSELAEFLQERHNAVVALVNRAARRKLVRKKGVAQDRRFVRIELAPAGHAILRKLVTLHRRELARFQDRTGVGPALLRKKVSKSSSASRSKAARKRA